MKPKFLAFPSSLIFAASAVLMVLSHHSISAAILTWDGGDATSNSWTAANNWNPDAAPTFDNTTDVVINTLTRPIGFISDNTTVKSLSFGANVDGAFSIRMIGFPAPSFAQAARNLTFDADSGNATVTVDADATGDINIGIATGDTGSLGNPFLADNLDVIHNGTGLLLFNRPFQAGAFSITKSGTGRMQTNNNNLLTGALNINAGTLIANTYDANGADLNKFSEINLGGGTLEIRPYNNGTTNAAKNYATVPVNVNTASTLTYSSPITTTSYIAQFTGANAFVLNADLTFKNTSTSTTLTNSFNIARPITGTADIIIQSDNVISVYTDDFNARRVSLNGNNKNWSGDIVIAKGTGALGGTVAVENPVNVNAAGTGDIIIGTAGSALGAGLVCTPGANVTYANDIIVNTGDGFRAIKGGGNNFSVTFTGNVTLNKDLTVDHTWQTDKRFTFNGPISGVGGLTITRAGLTTTSTLVLGGTNDYEGATTVTTGASLSLASTCSLISNITVKTGARIGGAGSTTGTLTLDPGANFFFFFSASPFAPMNVTGSAMLDNTFGVASLVGGSQGEAIVWENVAPGTYTLIGTTSSTFGNITNFGSGNEAPVAAGKTAYFQNGGGSGGGGLQLVVTGPSAYENWKTTNGTTGGLDEDHDGDGVDNGTEYYLGGNTITTGFTPLPGVVANSVTWPAASLNSGYSGVYGTHFVVETSETLEPGSWVTAPIGTGPDTVSIPFATAAQIRNVKYTFPTTGPKKFARLKVTGP